MSKTIQNILQPTPWVGAVTHLRWHWTVPAAGSSSVDANSVALPRETGVFVLHMDPVLVFTGKISNPGGFTDSLPGSEPALHDNKFEALV